MAGLALGAAAGAYVGRCAFEERPANASPALVDWDLVQRIAVGMNRGEALTAASRERLDREYRDLVAGVLPEVCAYTGFVASGAAERTRVVDRIDWVHANLAQFEQLFSAFDGLASSDGSVASALLSGVNRQALSGELGVLLGYLARRVLGQYDLSLLGKESIDTSQLLFVEPNIVAAERALGVPSAHFRRWLALHEVTHVVEFEGVPWLRPYFNGLLETYMAYLKEDIVALRSGFPALRGMVGRAVAQHRDGLGWFEAMMSPDQRVLFSRMQAAMCMVEGYSNHVMNAIGRETLPSYEAITSAFARRQAERSTAERMFIRLTGLEMKLEQYRLGEAFIDRIVAAQGHDVARRIWDGPDALPTMDEVHAPELWLARMGVAASASA